ncbi:hypothetical protein [Microtetraspora sp. NBRC 13810]|uniref:hypothetical protein n=1 Tax=Microtetraspora sp. NBRC 13810 TaxID=3030990 RepID=UPI0025525FED|nr:hypothetical protein [Microtetraspora sp. NBRC 13810]
MGEPAWPLAAPVSAAGATPPPAGPASGLDDESEGETTDQWAPAWEVQPTDRLVYSSRTGAAPEEPPAAGRGAAPGSGRAGRGTAEAAGLHETGWTEPPSKAEAGGDFLDPEVAGLDVPARRRSRTMLLSAAAVVVLLGGTAAGVQLMSGSPEKATPLACDRGTTCATTGPNQVVPDDTDEPVLPEETESEPAEEQPTADDSTAPPADPISAPADAPQRTTPAKPRKERAETGPDMESQATPPPDVDDTQQGAVQQPLDASAPAEDGEIGTPASSAPPTSVPSASPRPPTRDPQEPQGPRPTSGPSGDGDGPHWPPIDIEIGFDLLRAKPASYTASIVLSNDSGSDLAGTEVSIPVGGVVSDVKGVTWKQRGSTLVLDAPKVRAGKDVVITFTATGTAKPPTSCSAPGTSCRTS